MKFTTKHSINKESNFLKRCIIALKQQVFDRQYYKIEVDFFIVKNFGEEIKNMKITEKKKNLKLLNNIDVSALGLEKKLIFSYFKQELNSILQENFNDNTEPILTRPVNPPSEAYEYVAFSKLDIKPTGRSYGLLFE